MQNAQEARSLPVKTRTPTDNRSGIAVSELRAQTVRIPPHFTRVHPELVVVDAEALGKKLRLMKEGMLEDTNIRNQKSSYYIYQYEDFRLLCNEALSRGEALIGWQTGKNGLCCFVVMATMEGRAQGFPVSCKFIHRT